MNPLRTAPRRIASAVALTLLLLPTWVRAQDVPAPPDLMDPLGRYQLQFPQGWQVVGTNSKLNGFVIGNGKDSFVAVYRDGKLSIDQTKATMASMCSCGIPDDAKVEALGDTAYPAQLIRIGQDDRGTAVVGTVVFPGGMFGLVSVFKSEQTPQALRDVLRHARPGPSRPK
jgi:hypothetical protein